MGIVVSVSGGVIRVIEGNKSDAVGYRDIPVNGKFIRGFCLPDYGKKAGAAAPPSGAAAAIGKLAKLGVINSPDYWQKVVSDGRVKYLDDLLVKAAEKITGPGTRSSTVENAVGALVAAGVINSPDYWLENRNADKNLGALLCALGGAVR